MSRAGVEIRAATVDDVPGMQRCRQDDPADEPPDPRLAAYFEGTHHPQQALPPRTGYIALAKGEVVAYIAGHLTTRQGAEGEVQYLYVAPAYRRRGIATALLRHLMEWFDTHGAYKVCFALADDSHAEARPFYESAGASPFRKYWYGWADIRAVHRRPS